MPTFTPPTPLTERITNAKRDLEAARTSGHLPLIESAERVLNGLLDRLPRWRSLAVGYPELDAQLRVDME